MLPFNLIKGLLFTHGTRSFEVIGVWKKEGEVTTVEFVEKNYEHKTIVRSKEYLESIEIRYKGIK